MQFSVGDRIVHPHHGPGRVAGVERKEFMDGAKRYYVIEIPGQGLTMHIPVSKVDDVGIRPAMPPSKLPQVLNKLRSSPRHLPDDYRERQEQIGEQLRTGRVMQLAQVVRDLTWHRHRAHLTRKDLDCLKQGQRLLAAEMALVSGNDISKTSKLIEATMISAMANGAEQKRAT